MQRTTKITLIVSGLVVAACLVAVGVVNLLSPAQVVSSDGVSGIKDDFVFAKRLIGYGTIAVGGSFIIACASIAIRMFAGALTPLATGFGAWVKSLVLEIAAAMKPAPLALETVLGVKDGKPFTLQDYFNSANAKIKAVTASVQAIESNVAVVDARTSHIEPPPPPPPPKTDAQIIAELQLQIAAMQAAKPVVTAPVKAPTEAAS